MLINAKHYFLRIFSSWVIFFLEKKINQTNEYIPMSTCNKNDPILCPHLTFYLFTTSVELTQSFNRPVKYQEILLCMRYRKYQTIKIGWSRLYNLLSTPSLPLWRVYQSNIRSWFRAVIYIILYYYCIFRIYGQFCYNFYDYFWKQYSDFMSMNCYCT